jgi:hypothetical protein
MIREQRYHIELGGSPETWAAIVEIQREQDARNTPILRAAEAIRRWRAEDAAKGETWA